MHPNWHMLLMVYIFILLSLSSVDSWDYKQLKRSKDLFWVFWTVMLITFSDCKTYMLTHFELLFPSLDLVKQDRSFYVNISMFLSGVWGELMFIQQKRHILLCTVKKLRTAIHCTKVITLGFNCELPWASWEHFK